MCILRSEETVKKIYGDRNGLKRNLDIYSHVHTLHPDRCRDRISAFVKSFESRGEKAPFLFILNILLPGIPVVSTVMYWAMDVERKAPSEEGLGSHAPFLEVLKRYGQQKHAPPSLSTQNDCCCALPTLLVLRRRVVLDALRRRAALNLATLDCLIV